MAHTGQLRRFKRDQRGGVALLFGLALPVLGMGAAAAVEYASLARQNAQLQKAADTAAVAATKELTLANTNDSNVASIARSMALSSLAASGSADAASATVTSEVLNQRTSVRVTLVQPVTNMMGKLLSLPLSELSAKATARLSGSTRLCVLTLDP